MEITDELIAKYVDGTATTEEATCVRQYLIQHPEERESILLLMDEHEDYLGEWEEDTFGNTKRSAFTDIMMSAAAFAPPHKSVKMDKRRTIDDSLFLSRLSHMLDELDQID